MKDSYIVTNAGTVLTIWRGQDGVYSAVVARVGLNPRVGAEERKAIQAAIAAAVAKIPAPAAPLTPRKPKAKNPGGTP